MVLTTAPLNSHGLRAFRKWRFFAPQALGELHSFVYMPSRMLTLHYRDTAVGGIENAFVDQGTWFGDFQVFDLIKPDSLADRLCQFMDFCRNWHFAADSLESGDASDFDRFSDMTGTQDWSISDETGARIQITAAPMFIGGRTGDISWIMPSEQ